MPDFIQIPGPNPILVPGAPGAWDDGVVESCDAIKDCDTYHLYYHGTSTRTGYQIGLATAPHPLGPWTKVGSEPVLALGPQGSWEDRGVACAAILKEGADRYLMWYSGISNREGDRWHIGLATASDLRGPWVKHPGNPIIPDFGYVGGVMRVGGLYFLYAEHPIGSTGQDYGPIALATADVPDGPWTPYEGNPVLRQGEWGEWDDGGFSEARVVYQDGLFHLFYGGAKLHPTRILSRESIGYATSTDGLHFTKHPGNPIAPREANPDAAAFAEVHAYHEPPFWYLYHTLRYNSRDGAEDLGVQVLATQRPFALTMPVLEVEALAPLSETPLTACKPVSLAAATRWSVTVEYRCGRAARLGPRLLLARSHDGLSYDTELTEVAELPCLPGEVVRQTVEMPAGGLFAKLQIVNPDPARPVRDLRAWATLHG